ncbi:hypothetical protein QBC35DRAFT_396054 [Podospora australis]|uniref:Uncharacterized protein n=1 Tax=Podospora australis TaxID=1536484 RepID=A0AAN6WJH0_9PEZI|nr:hypothetical protein QBC35DRAFT_396054 [Podospora australis]
MSEWEWPEVTAAFNVIKATLQYPVDEGELGSKAARLADDIAFICKTAADPFYSNAAWVIWESILQIVYCIPPGHSWQECLVQAVANLSCREEPLSSKFKHSEAFMWKRLPDLNRTLLERWNPPQYDGRDFAEELERYTNVNSSFARFTGASGRIRFLPLPIAQLRIAHEEASENKDNSVVEYQLWVATEWIIYRGGQLLEEFIDWEGNGQELDDEEETGIYGRGPLAAGMRSLSINRWISWKRRLTEIAASGGGQAGKCYSQPNLARTGQDGGRGGR